MSGRVGDVQLAEIMSQADGNVPYYVPALVAEIRHLRQQMMRARNRIESSRCSKLAPLVDAVTIIDAALTDPPATEGL
jgi:capsule polysaccharide export protein KpsE/RkpR